MSTFDQWLADRASDRSQQGLVRRLFASDTDGPMIDLAGNDYLGLSRHPRVVGGAIKAAEEYGAGAGASRLVTGTLSIHDELERSLAEFTGWETALVHSTGYHANLAVVSALAAEDTLIVSDAHVHASLIDACRLSRGTVTVVPHNDVSAVNKALRTRTQSRAMVLVESIYSVLGDAAPLAELGTICAEADALLLVDEAHGLGVRGLGGRGLVHEAGLGGRSDVVVTATLSKSFGSQGGVVLATSAIRDHLINTARPFIFDTGLAPAAAGAALAALEVILEEPQRVSRLLQVAEFLAATCGVESSDGAVLAIGMPGPDEAVAAVHSAAAQGVRIGCFRPPSTPDGVSRLRLTAHAHLTESDLDRAEAVLGGLW